MGIIDELVFSFLGELFTPGPRSGQDPHDIFACGQCRCHRARQRQPNDEEAGKVKGDSQIVELTTETATLEWAVPVGSLEWALKRVRSSWPSEVSPA